MTCWCVEDFCEPPNPVALARFGVDRVSNKPTKSVVANSLAMVKWGIPELGLGTLATTSRPSSIVIRNVLLNIPSGYLMMEMH